MDGWLAKNMFVKSKNSYSPFLYCFTHIYEGYEATYVITLEDSTSNSGVSFPIILRGFWLSHAKMGRWESLLKGSQAESQQVNITAFLCQSSRASIWKCRTMS